ncbi:MAG: hydantoinase/oxoprolinase family protein [Hyphomicrobiaceae bacterium]
MSRILGVDVGGTFTDFFLIDDQSGETWVHKVNSTPDDPSRAILQGIDALTPDMPDGLAFLAHGTTVATNALIQRRGANVALITTAGFRDLLEIGRQTRPKIYDLKIDNPEPLVPRHLRFEVTERIDGKGAVDTPLAEADLDDVIDKIKASGADAVAVCFLFAFLNPCHEQVVGQALRARLPGVEISLSSEIQPEFREYERFSTTVLNAYLQPLVSRYMNNLADALADRARDAKIGISQSSGGLMSIERAAAVPIRTALSGPAAGVIGAVALGRLSGHTNLITFDMGGTSTDVCLVRECQAEMAYARNVADFPVRMPMIDIHTVGAGGGSIAYLDRDGLLKVGPRSAGAVPGPACYGLGGTEPTVTDANLVLGRLPAELVGGGMRLDTAKAETAVATIADKLGLGVTETAHGIIRIVNSNMVRAIRAVSVERGYDPRRFTLTAFGGAGALHAVEVARELDIPAILVPPAPGILCAEGVAAADLEEAFVATCRTPLTAPLDDVEAHMRRLQQEAEAWFAAEAVPRPLQRVATTFDMRYVGQNFELSVPIDDSTPTTLDREQLRDDFFVAHKTKYGHFDPDAAIEIVNVRVVARQMRPPLERKAPGNLGREAAATSATPYPVWFNADAPHETVLVDRTTLHGEAALDRPAVITQFDATTLLPPGYTLRVVPGGSLLIEVAP